MASLQVRLTVDGHSGPWFEASIADGYAWAAASLEYSGAKQKDISNYHLEDRAFDATGHELDINHARR